MHIHMEVREQLLGISFLFLPCWPWNWTHYVFGLGGKHLYPLSHLTDPMSKSHDDWMWQHRESISPQLGLQAYPVLAWALLCVCLYQWKSRWQHFIKWQLDTSFSPSIWPLCNKFKLYQTLNFVPFSLRKKNHLTSVRVVFFFLNKPLVFPPRPKGLADLGFSFRVESWCSLQR